MASLCLFRPIQLQLAVGLVVLISLTIVHPSWSFSPRLLRQQSPTANSIWGIHRHRAILPSPFARLQSSSSSNDDGTAAEGSAVDSIEFKSEEEKKSAVGNLVADDEWMGLSMELSDIVRTAVIEDIKSKARDFLGKDEYKVGDISKEMDSRIKEEVAKIRGKDEYEIGDFMLAMDELSKQYTEQLTGKPYEAGDLSKEIDKRVKSKVADYVGKDEYEFGDLSRAVAERVKTRVEEFTGKENYEFGDISRAIESRRREWVRNFLGDEAAADYQFGDITKKMLANFTGKDEYQFGDLSKKIFGDLFGKGKDKKK